MNRVRRSFLAAAALLATSGPCRTAADARVHGDTGRVCVGPIAPATAGPKTLANPRGGDAEVAFSVRIDEGLQISVAKDRGQWVEGLTTSDKHSVVIYADGRRTQSFRFSFETFDGDDLCLWYKSLYGTWQLWERERSPWCRCEP